jgi:hypothetical protein
MSREELNDWIAELKEGGQAITDGGDVSVQEAIKVPSKVFKFKLFGDEAASVIDAIEDAKKTLDTKDDSEAFRYVMVQYAFENTNIEVPIEEAIANLEARYGVKVMVTAN